MTKDKASEKIKYQTNKEKYRDVIKRKTIGVRKKGEQKEETM